MREFLESRRGESKENLGRWGSSNSLSSSSSSLSSSSFNSSSSLSISSPTTPRASFVLAWLALQAGEAAAGHDILHSPGDRSEVRRALRTNLRLVALARLHRPGEAVALLEGMVDREDMPERPDRTKARFAREVVREVVEEVAREADPTLATRLRQVFRRLDASAEVVDQTVLEMLLLPIQWNTSVEVGECFHLTKATTTATTWPCCGGGGPASHWWTLSH